MIIYRHIFKEYCLCLLTIAMVLLMIFMINTLEHLLNLAMSGKLTVLLVLQVILLKSPNFLGYLLPLAAFLTVLVVNGKFYASRQFDVLFASGVSRLRLMMISVVFMILVAALVGFIIIWVSPRLNMYQTRQTTQVVNDFSIDHVLPQHFHSFEKGKVVFYADKADHLNDVLKQVFIASASKTQADAWDVVVAERAKVLRNTQLGEYAELQNGYRYQGSSSADSGFKATQFNEFKHSYIYPKTDKVHYKVGAIPFMQLWHARSGNTSYQSWIEWYIAMPVSTLILGLIAFPLSKVNPRDGKYAKFIPAILLYAGYMNFLYVGRDWVAKGSISFLTGLFSVHLLMLLIAMTICAVHFRWFRRCAS